MELKAGEHIFRKGEPVDAVYVVESGELSVVKPLRQGEEDGAVGVLIDQLAQHKSLVSICQKLVSHLLFAGRGV